MKKKWILRVGFGLMFAGYLVMPFIAGLFKIGQKDGPRIYPRDYHSALYTVAWEMTADPEKDGIKPRVSASHERPWFYGFDGELTKEEKNRREEMDKIATDVNRVSRELDRFDELRKARDLPNTMTQKEGLDVVQKQNRALEEQFRVLMSLDREQLTLDLHLRCLMSEDEGQVLTAGEVLYRISPELYNQVHEQLLESRPKYLEAFEGVKERFKDGKIGGW